MDHTNEQTPLISGTGDESTSANDAFLVRFQQAIGINATTTSAHNDIESARRSATGIYKQVISAQKSRQRQFVIVETIFYTGFLANIIIGATLASLGSLKTVHSTTITVLGVVNSSSAGILALLKGQGLPDRLRKDEFEMRKVQDFIEQTETRLAYGLIPDMDEKALGLLVKEVQDMYDVARDTAEMNRPASYVHQVDTRPDDDGEEAGQGTGGEAHGAVEMARRRQTKLALSSGKGKSLVIS